MKLLELQIDRFGPWSNLTLDLPGDLATFYGPNEAGKSSLMKFIRGVLFGFKATHPDASGSMRVELGETERRLTRTADGDRGRLQIDGVAEGAAAERWLSEQLGGVGEDLFVSIFAIGLEDMQQLSALDRDEIAESIYGLSLGPEGERLTVAHSRLLAGREELLSAETQQGRLTRLLRRRTDASDQLAKLPDEWEHFDRVAEQIETIRRETVRLERDRDGLRQQIRGVNVMELAHKPWARQRELRRELDRLGPVSAIERHDLSSELDDLERQIAQLAADRKRLRGEDAGLKRQYEELSTQPAVAVHSCRIDALLEEEPLIRDQRNRLKDYERQRSEAKRRQEQTAAQTPAIAAMRAGITVSTGPQSSIDLYREADAYKAAKRRYKRLQSRYESSKKLQARQTDALKEVLGGLGESAADVREATHRDLKKLDSLSTLVQKERLLEARRGLLQQAPTGSWLSILPDFIYPVLWFFALGGIALMIAGGYLAFTSVVFLGFAYALAGFSFLGVSWTLGRIGGAGAEGGYVDMMRETENRLRDTRRELDRLDPPSRPQQVYRGQVVPAVGGMRGAVEGETSRLRKRLLEMDRAEELERSLADRRGKLTQSRQLLRTERQRVSDARQSWLKALRANGLEETLKTSDALDAWQQQSRSLTEDEWSGLETAQAEAIAEAVAGTLAQAQMEKADALCELARRDLEAFDRRIADLAARTDQAAPHGDPFAWLRRLQSEVEETTRRKKDRLSIRSRRRDLQTAIREVESRHASTERTYANLLSEFGVSNRDDLTRRLRDAGRVSELQSEIDGLSRELMSLTERESDLAFTEDDLVAFDPSRMAATIESLEEKLFEIETQLDERRETLGRLEAEREELASSRKAASLRFERDQADAALDQLAVDYLAAGLAAEAIESVRVQIEENAQPATLRRASEYLAQLTVGRYPELTVDRDERLLFALDDEGESWPIETLSTGTREQVFLAVRLAIADEFAEDGGALPLVLDDVLVNFDQDRTAAALETLGEVSDTGQQVVLFTCHRHVAKLLESQGREAQRMPVRDELRAA